MSHARIRRRAIVAVSVVVWAVLVFVETLELISSVIEAVVWVGMFGVASVVSALALWDATRTLREAEEVGRRDLLISANGAVRTEAVRLLVRLLMLVVGASALAAFDEIIVPALFGAAAWMMANTLLSREYRRELRDEIRGPTT